MERAGDIFAEGVYLRQEEEQWSGAVTHTVWHQVLKYSPEKILTLDFLLK